MKKYIRFKYILDRLFAAVLLIVLLPLFLVIAVVITAADGTPVFFTQTRAGLYGKNFTLYKFRTMTKPQTGQNAHSTCRITRSGAILRRFGLDELPQLINILRGEMSFIGPRPLLCEYLSLYTDTQSRRHNVKPGITGWAQVNGRNSSSWEARLEYDREYADTASLPLDLKIFFLTLKCIFAGTGVAHSSASTMPPFKGTRDVSLLILGMGGHGRVVAEAAMSRGLYKRIAFLDDNPSPANKTGYECLGRFEDFYLFKKEFGHAAVALGDNFLRLQLINRLKAEGFSLPVVIHTSAVVSPSCIVGEGSAVLSGAAVTAGARIGRGCILNTLSGVDHDCVLGDGVHICPGAHIAGGVTIGERTTVYTGVSVANGIKIGSDSLIAAGAAVVRDIGDGVMAAGVPAAVKKGLTRHEDTVCGEDK